MISNENKEKFILAQDKNTFLSTFSSQSKEYIYFSNLLQLQNEKNIDIDKIEKFYNDFKEPEINNLRIKSYLLKLKSCKDQESTRKQIIQKLNKICCLESFNQDENSECDDDDDCEEYEGDDDCEEYEGDDDCEEYEEKSNKKAKDTYLVPKKDQIIQKSYNNLYELKNINKEYLNEIDFQKIILTEDTEMIFYFLKKCSEFFYKDFVKFYIECCKFSKDLDENDNKFKKLINSHNLLNNYPIQTLYSILTQYDLIRKNEQFIQILIQKELCILQQSKFDQNLKFYKNLQTRYKFLNSQNIDYCINYMIMKLYYDNYKYDQQVFEAYIQNPLLNLNKEIKNFQQINDTWFTLFNIEKDEIIKIVDENLIQYFKQKNQYKDLVKYFDEKYLEQIYYETRLFMGDQIDNIDKFINKSRLNQLQQQKILKFSRKNPKIYQSNDLVQLSIELKNVKEIQIKTFQIQPYSYLKQGKELDINIDIDGLVSNNQESILIQKLDIIQHEIIIPIDVISKANIGIFVVEVQDEDISIRTIIQKGCFTYAENFNRQGQQFQIFDQSNSRVKDVQMIIDDQIFQSDYDGNILIPYVQKPMMKQAILLKQMYAQQITFNWQKENFKFQNQLFYDIEQFRPNKNANLMVRPQLTLNDNEISLDQIKNFTIQISFEGRMQQKFQYKMSYQAIQNYEILFPNQTKQITVQITGQVQKMDESFEDIFYFKSIDVAQYFSCQIMSLFLERDQQNFIINVLGKNGEQFKDHNINISVVSKVINKTYKKNLKTNQNGKVFIQYDQDIQKIKGTVYQQSLILLILDEMKTFHRQWDIDNDEKINYQSHIQIPQQDKIILPYIKGNQYDLFLMNQEEIIEIKNDQIILNDQTLILQDLKEGSYQLFMNNIKISQVQYIQLKIQIIQKLKIENQLIFADKFIYQENQINEVLTINDFKIQDNKIVFKTNQNSEAIIFFKQFIDPNLNIDIQNNKINNQWKINQPQNIYLENRYLSTESQYVHFRRQQNQYTGNSLDKCCLLMNRQFKRNCKYEQEELQQQTNYQSNEKEEKKKGKKKKISMEKNQQSSNENSECGDDCEEYDEQYYNKAEKILRLFLKNQSHIVVLKPNSQNIIEYELENLKSFNQIKIFICKNRQTYMKNFYQDQKDIQKNDMTINLEKQQQSLKRNIGQFKKGQTLELPLNNQGFKIYDSYKQLYDMFNLFDDYSDKECIQKLCSNWNDFNLQEKNDYYNKFVCDEINLFIFFKDKNYFNQIKQSIIDKLDKTFTDYFLINDFKNLQTFDFLKLNNIQQCLLISKFVQHNQKQKAIELYQIIQKNISLENQNFSLVFDQFYKQQLEPNDDYDSDNISENDENYVGQDNDEEEEYCGGGGGGAEYGCSGSFSNQKKKQQAVKKYQAPYQKLGQVKEFKEQSTKFPIYFKENPFWLDYAKFKLDQTENHDSNDGFLSQNIIYCMQQQGQMISAFCCIDLGFQSNQYKVVSKDKITIEFESNAIILYINQFQPQTKIQNSIQMFQRIYPYSERHNVCKKLYKDDYQDKNLKKQKYDQIDKFQINTIYQQEIMIMNVSQSAIKLLIQTSIPEGAIPIQKNDKQVIKQICLQSFNSQSFKFRFYFPKEGNFGQQEIKAIYYDEIVATHQNQNYTVESLQKQDNIDFKSIIKSKNKNKILKYIEDNFSNNFIQYNQYKYEKFLTDLEFYKKLKKIYEQNLYFSNSLYRFSIYHNDYDDFMIYLQYRESLKNYFQYLELEKIKIDKLQALEYYPMVQSRFYQINGKILNVQFKETYQQLLQYLLEKNNYEDKDYLIFSYYLLAQERIEESKKQFDKINNRQSIQCEYLACYFDIFTGQETNFKIARQLSVKYVDYPILQWRKRFIEIIDLLCQYDGEYLVQNEELKNRTIQSEQTFTCYLKNQNIIINSQNIQQFKILYYFIDAEVLFSRSPFIQNFSGISNFEPNIIETVNINQEIQQVPILQDLLNKTLLIQIQFQQKIEQLNYQPINFQIFLYENQGILKTSKDQKPLQKCYVKVFAQLNNQEVVFYKDGFTDICGKFNYVDSNNEIFDSVNKFSILVYNEQYGTIIRQTNKPSEIGTFVEKVDYKDWISKQNSHR